MVARGPSVTACHTRLSCAWRDSVSSASTSGTLMSARERREGARVAEAPGRVSCACRAGARPPHTRAPAMAATAHADAPRRVRTRPVITTADRVPLTGA
jgi:hypothetical protein